MGRSLNERLSVWPSIFWVREPTDLAPEWVPRVRIFGRGIARTHHGGMNSMAPGSPVKKCEVSIRGFRGSMVSFINPTDGSGDGRSRPDFCGDGRVEIDQ
jgi:hypothetical protein